MTFTMPIFTSSSLDIVLRKFGKFLSLERRGDDDDGEIWKLSTAKHDISELYYSYILYTTNKLSETIIMLLG